MAALAGFIVGLALGAAGAASWLTSEPEPGASPHASGNPLEARVSELKARVTRALAEGKQAGAGTEDRMRQELQNRRQAARRPSS